MPRKVSMRVTLDDETFMIPYGREAYEEGIIHPYRSLVNHPEQIDRIPELIDQPAIRQLLEVINASEGRLESVRIDSTYHEYDGAVVHVAVVGCIFRDRRLFGCFDSCMLFAGKLLETLHAEQVFPANEDAAQLELQRATLTEEHRDGWIMDLFLLGQGTNRAQCDAQLALRCRALQRLLQQGI